MINIQSARVRDCSENPFEARKKIEAEARPKATPKQKTITQLNFEYNAKSPIFASF
jgi:hypothetical protein